MEKYSKSLNNYNNTLKKDKIIEMNCNIMWHNINGITLISLIITIIILITLAGIVINLCLEENGLFKKAQNATDKYLTAAEDEEKALNELYKELGMIYLPENTKDTLAGTEVKLPESWTTTTASYVSTEDGTVVKKMVKSSNVIAIATGNGQTVPVPKGFYYVGGTLDSGVVISDYEEDKNKYAGIEDVPVGITLKEDNTINYELKGNLFVWIPSTIDSYEKYDWGTSYRSIIYNFDIPASEKIQIQKYEGFYVGRFEAGLASTINELETTTTNGEQTNYNSYAMPQSKAGLVPWNFIDYFHAKVNADNMYNTEYVQSGLITGAMWDTMIIWMANGIKNSDILVSAKLGNFASTTPKINIGRKAYTYYSSLYKTDKFETTWSQSTQTNIITKPAGTQISGKNEKNSYILTTGSSEECKLKNLYDVAGNLSEWTEEAALATTSSGVLTNARVQRGGSAMHDIAVCYRNYNNSIRTGGVTGYRVALYIK